MLGTRRETKHITPPAHFSSPVGKSQKQRTNRSLS